MSECTNRQLGLLLHAYEVNALSDADAERFELHLFECEHCLEKLKAFNASVTLLRNDGDVESVFVDIAQSESLSLVARLRRRLWPQGPLVAKPALLHLVILLLLIPTFLWLSPGEQAGFREVSQTLELTTTRLGMASEDLSFSRSAGDDALLIFSYAGAQPGKDYRVVIEREDGTTAYHNDHFTRFDTFGSGKLQLNLEVLDTGPYRLTISDPHDAAAPSQEYFFEVVE